MGVLQLETASPGRHPFRLAASRQATFPKGTASAVAGNFTALPKAVPLGKVAANAVSRRKGYCSYLRPPRKKVAQKRPQAFLSNKLKILFPLQRRRPPPVAETGRSCWGSGQQDAIAAQGTMRMLGAATRKARRAFPIVLFRKLPCRGRRRFRPAAPQCAAVGCILPHARCGWVHRS